MLAASSIRRTGREQNDPLGSVLRFPGPSEVVLHCGVKGSGRLPARHGTLQFQKLAVTNSDRVEAGFVAMTVFAEARQRHFEGGISFLRGRTGLH
jgi:hypothetical protein